MDGQPTYVGYLYCISDFIHVWAEMRNIMCVTVALRYVMDDNCFYFKFHSISD